MEIVGSCWSVPRAPVLRVPLRTLPEWVTSESNAGWSFTSYLNFCQVPSAFFHVRVPLPNRRETRPPCVRRLSVGLRGSGIQRNLKWNVHDSTGSKSFVRVLGIQRVPSKREYGPNVYENLVEKSYLRQDCRFPRLCITEQMTLNLAFLERFYGDILPVPGSLRYISRRNFEITRLSVFPGVYHVKRCFFTGVVAEGEFFFFFHTEKIKLRPF